MIAVVEGPSAAGKTTWCRRHGYPVVEEYAPTANEREASDLRAQAAHWVGANCVRWEQALALEREHSVVVCDSDPLKLHYSWCLARVGAAPWDSFEHNLLACRLAFVAGRLGFADLVLVSIPPLKTLRAYREADRSRGRSHFDLHAQLSSPLREWYEAVDALEPGHVIWHLPAAGLPAALPTPRRHRSDPARLDKLVTLLPTP